MSINGVGGAASLPVTLPSPPGAATPATQEVPATGQAGGDLRLPGQRATKREAGTSTAEAPKPDPLPPLPPPPPLPPLRGLTVAEVRAMLGIAPLPGQSEAAAGARGSDGVQSQPASIISAALDRYA